MLADSGTESVSPTASTLPATLAEPVTPLPAQVAVAAVVAAPAMAGSPLGVLAGWEVELEAEAISLLAAGRTDVWNALTHRFESRMILAALANTKGRRIEAAQKLGIGRNTITRKIQELGLE